MPNKRCSTQELIQAKIATWLGRYTTIKRKKLYNIQLVRNTRASLLHFSRNKLINSTYPIEHQQKFKITNRPLGTHPLYPHWGEQNAHRHKPDPTTSNWSNNPIFKLYQSLKNQKIDLVFILISRLVKTLPSFLHHYLIYFEIFPSHKIASVISVNAVDLKSKNKVLMGRPILKTQPDLSTGQTTEENSTKLKLLERKK